MLKTISNSVVLTLLLVLLVVTIVMVTIIIILPKLVAKGINVEKSIATAKDALNTSDQILKVADKLLPNNPAIDILQTIESYAKKAVEGAEQLYLSSQLPIDERLIEANKTINSALKVLDVEVTPDIQVVINGAIQAEVLALGHKDLTEAQKQAAVTQLQTTIAQLTAKNQQLSQSFLQIKNTVSTIQ
ncbi:MAG TPA: hypothetical protein VIK26_02500 [Clostridium sp.]